MRKVFFAGVILLSFSCNKNKPEKKDPDPIQRCGTILSTPVLDSFVSPTYYITMIVAYPEGDEMVHLQGQVSGDHDGSWFLSRYNKDSTFCSTPITK